MNGLHYCTLKVRCLRVELRAAALTLGRVPGGGAVHKSVLACLVVEQFCHQMPRSCGVPVPQSLGSGWLPEHEAMTPLGRGVGNGPASLPRLWQLRGCAGDLQDLPAGIPGTWRKPGVLLCSF